MIDVPIKGEDSEAAKYIRVVQIGIPGQMLKGIIRWIPAEGKYPCGASLASISYCLRPAGAVSQDNILLVVVGPCHMPVVTVTRSVRGSIKHPDSCDSCHSLILHLRRGSSREARFPISSSACRKCAPSLTEVMVRPLANAVNQPVAHTKPRTGVEVIYCLGSHSRYTLAPFQLLQARILPLVVPITSDARKVVRCCRCQNRTKKSDAVYTLRAPSVF